jgi:hypothetical protein
LDGDEKGSVMESGEERRKGWDVFFKKILHTGFFISWCGECDVILIPSLSLVNNC